MRFSLLLWSFVAAFCFYNFLTVGELWTAVIFGSGFFVALYLWIYALIAIIRTDFPVQVKLNIDTKVNGKNIKKDEDEV